MLYCCPMLFSSSLLLVWLSHVVLCSCVGVLNSRARVCCTAFSCVDPVLPTELDEAVDLFYQWRDDMERRKELARRKRTAEGAGITTTTVSPAVPRPSSSAPSSSSASNRGGASNRHRNNSDSDSGSDSDSDGDGDSSHLVSAGRSVVGRDRVVPRDRAGLHHQQQMFLDVSEDEEEDEDEEEEEDEEDEEAEQQQRGAGIVEDSGEEDGGM